MTVKRHFKPEQNKRVVLEVSPKSAEWKYLSFKVISLKSGETEAGNSGKEEIVIVPLAGEASIKFNNETHPLQRADLFTESADIVYLPPGTPFEIVSGQFFEFAVGGAPADGSRPARVVRAKDIPRSVRGDGNVKRGVSALLDSDEYSERLTVYEIHTPSGNWSSFPPHRHDTRDGSSYHEETYYYRLNPADGFAIQRLYTRDTDLDVAVPVGDGDLVLIHEGYHPVVKAPGTNAYYLNFLTGDVRKISAINDPHYDWVSKNWSGNPLEIPLKG
jgi:5-deoxy-glucuronate isomerase